MIRPRPQRIFSPSPPGALLKRTGAAQSPQRPRNLALEDADYTAKVQACPCIKCGMDPCGTAAHLRMNSGLHNKRQAMAKKPDIKWISPMCAGCHLNDPDAQHRIGEEEFWNRLGIDPFSFCERLYAQGHDLVAMRAVVFVEIAGRSSFPK